MLIPYSTDAPIYHYPIATISLIVVNVIMFVAFCIGGQNEPDHVSLVDSSGNPVNEVDVATKIQQMERLGQDPSVYLDSLKRVEDSNGTVAQRLKLEFGKGLLPWQWISSMFMHGGILHLVGNMVFLWSFGLVIEGKLGNIVFPALYLVMGVVQAAVVQTVMLFSDGSALGASGAIYSVLALVVIFAPVNSFEVLVLFGFRVFTFEMPILSFGLFYVFWNGAFFFIGGAGMGSEALHLIGFVVGLPVGFVLLTRGLVDCEGYDIISHWQGKEGRASKVGKKQLKQRRAKQREKEVAIEAGPAPAQMRTLMDQQIGEAIQQGNLEVAVALQRKQSINAPGSSWSQPNLLAVIQGYSRKKDFAKAEPLIAQHIDLFELHRFAMQVNLIKIWLQLQRPRHALRYMQGINAAFQSPDEQQQIKKLADYAKKQISAGILEVD